MKPVPGPPNDTDGESPNPATDELFGIPPKAHFSTEILKRIKGLTGKSDINIQSVRREQFREIYFFQKGNETSRVDINYSGKNKITKITTPNQTELSLEIIELISPLEGLVISVTPKISIEIEFEEKFLNDFHKRLRPLVEQKEIRIVNVESFEYRQRYTFSRSGENAVFDIIFNGKKQFTKYAPVKNLCTSNSFSTDIQTILTKGLSQ
ncbi:uncharacterized protein METZ01_LOCUS470448 [marine metagenome]|uniref:TATA-binding-like protein domain-containing protein n=1 Tax=marine metagenome TaxID=408172 RepID=A0A383BCK5_9ZZZZ